MTLISYPFFLGAELAIGGCDSYVIVLHPENCRNLEL
jgi:hypothetical protein